MFPITNLPRWMAILVAINPLTYGVDALRGVILGFSNYSLIANMSIISGFGIAMIIAAMIIFGKVE